MKTQLFTNRVMTFMMPAHDARHEPGVGGASSGSVAMPSMRATMQTGDLIAFITYSMVIIMGFLMIGMLSIMLPRADVAAQRIDEVLACKPSIVDPEPGKAKDALLGADGLPGARIAFENVSFKLLRRRRVRARGCQLHVPSRVRPRPSSAPPGSGKSTVHQAGRSASMTSRRAASPSMASTCAMSASMPFALSWAMCPRRLFCSAAPSPPTWVTASTMPMRTASAAAADVAQASEFIAERTEGLATPISQGGTNVSGGQRQRLAIARALATDARAYLFDDSFSALDYKTDAALRHELCSRLGRRSHRDHRGPAHLHGAQRRPASWCSTRAASSARARMSS